MPHCDGGVLQIPDYNCASCFLRLQMRWGRERPNANTSPEHWDSWCPLPPTTLHLCSWQGGDKLLQRAREHSWHLSSAFFSNTSPPPEPFTEVHVPPTYVKTHRLLGRRKKSHSTSTVNIEMLMIVIYCVSHQCSLNWKLKNKQTLLHGRHGEVWRCGQR